MEKYITTQEDLQIIEQKLKDYDSLQSLMEIITSIYEELIEKIETKAKKRPKHGKLELSLNSDLSSEENADEYTELEKILQKHESEIRNHIRIEQQLKLFAENIQQKCEDSEK